jgi:hypothetical protein
MYAILLWQNWGYGSWWHWVYHMNACPSRFPMSSGLTKNNGYSGLFQKKITTRSKTCFKKSLYTSVKWCSRGLPQISDVIISISAEVCPKPSSGDVNNGPGSEVSPLWGHDLCSFTHPLYPFQIFQPTASTSCLNESGLLLKLKRAEREKQPMAHGVLPKSCWNASLKSSSVYTVYLNNVQ